MFHVKPARPGDVDNSVRRRATWWINPLDHYASVGVVYAHGKHHHHQGPLVSRDYVAELRAMEAEPITITTTKEEPMDKHTTARPAERTAGEAKINQMASERVAKVLTSIWRNLGPLTRSELEALMDGAQDAVMDWMPPSE